MIKKLKTITDNWSKEQWLIFLLFLLFACYSFLQHRLVGMYYDDFGNASLSYGYDSSNIGGVGYTLKDLMEWAKYTYFNWGGRILYALILIPMLKNGSHLFMEFQSILLVIIMYIMYKILKQLTKQKSYVVGILTIFGIYGFLQGDILTQGVYWASASVLYVWPMLFFFLIIYLINRFEKSDSRKLRLQYIELAVLIPFVTLSQEQIGGAFVVWAMCNLGIDIIKKNQECRKLDTFLVIYSGFTFGLFLSAPGNWVRLSTNNDYVQKKLIIRVYEGLKNVLCLLTNKDIRYFNFILTLAAFAMIFMLFEKKRNLFMGIPVLGVVPTFALSVLQIIGRNVSNRICITVYFIFLIDMFFLTVMYWWKKDEVKFISVMISAVASVFCLVFSPAFSLRSCIPYVMFCMLYCAVALNDFCNTIKMGKIGVIIYLVGGVLLVLSVNNAKIIYEGYEANYFYDNYNYNILKDYNGKDETIYLVNYDNSLYRGRMSCDAGFDYIDFWMKEYFDIPQSVLIEWKTENNLLDYAKSQKVDLKFGEGFYEDEGGYRWAENEATVIINNKTNEKSQVQLSAIISTGYSETAEVNIICNGEAIENLGINNQGIVEKMEIDLEPGKNCVTFITNANQIDSGADTRQLYMKFEKVVCEKK